MIWKFTEKKMGQDRFRLIIMNKKRDFKISYFWGKELFQIKRKFREKNRLFVIKLCAIHDQLFQFVFSSFGLDFSADLFYCLLEDTFCLKYCVQIFKLSAAPLGPKNHGDVNSILFLDFYLFVWGKG